MLSSQIKEVFIAQHAVDFRLGCDGLLAECYAMQLDPYAGDCVIFIHKSWRMLKVLCGDALGLCLLLRRFEGGALKRQFPFLSDKAFVTATHAQLALLIEGASYEVVARAKPWKKSKPGIAPEMSAVLRNPHNEKEKKHRNKTITEIGISSAERPPGGP